jgi:hypothetical protein
MSDWKERTYTQKKSVLFYAGDVVGSDVNTQISRLVIVYI